MYTVDLPPGIPDEMLDTLVQHFRVRLRRELIIMANKMGKPAPERSSMESESALSTATHESGPEVPRTKDSWVLRSTLAIRNRLDRP